MTGRDIYESSVQALSFQIDRDKVRTAIALTSRRVRIDQWASVCTVVFLLATGVQYVLWEADNESRVDYKLKNWEHDEVRQAT